MANLKIKLNLKEPIYWFCFGWCLILLVPFLPIMPSLQTFIHPWRPELAASLLFLITFVYLLFTQRDKIERLDLSRHEVNFIILPLLAFIAWSGLSIIWSMSWKSALYHTLIWTEYLIFYIVARQILNKRTGFKAFLASLTAAFLIIGLPAIFEYISLLIYDNLGSSSIGLKFSKYGELFNTIFPLLTVIVLRLNGKRFLGGLLVLSLACLFIVSTVSRTSLIIFAIGVIVILGLAFLFQRFYKYRRKMLMIAGAMIFAAVSIHLIGFLFSETAIPLSVRMNDDIGMNYSSDVRKLLKSVSLEMFEAHPVTGIGADNFGMQFNDYRAIYAGKNPSDLNLMTAEVESAERSHNEYLQVLAELGTVGGLIFAWFLFSIPLLILTALKRFSRISLPQFASLLGIGFFLAGSLVSSYSFRLVQNGMVFFFVLAVAAKSLLASKSEKESHNEINLSVKQLRLGYVLGIIACSLLSAHCLTRICSVYYTQKAQTITNLEEAIPYYETAFRLDKENPTAHFALGMNLLFAERYPEAATQFNYSIQKQRRSSIDFSFLATAQTLSGDLEAAEKTLAEATKLYPLSPFVRTRYATILKENGKDEASAAQLQISMDINKKQTDIWWTMMNEGGRKAAIRATQKDYPALLDLNPYSGVNAIIIEREIRHPEEKFVIPKVTD